MISQLARNSRFGTVEVGVVCGELGRALARGPFFSTIAMAAAALLTTGDAASRSEYLPEIAVGTTATLEDFALRRCESPVAA
jgi:hypothetical protein